MHQSFQQDLVRLRLIAARTVVQVNSNQSAAGNEKEQLKLSAQVNIADIFKRTLYYYYGISFSLQCCVLLLLISSQKAAFFFTQFIHTQTYILSNEVSIVSILVGRILSLITVNLHSSRRS